MVIQHSVICSQTVLACGWVCNYYFWWLLLVILLKCLILPDHNPQTWNCSAYYTLYITKRTRNPSERHSSLLLLENDLITKIPIIFLWFSDRTHCFRSGCDPPSQEHFQMCFTLSFFKKKAQTRHTTQYNKRSMWFWGRTFNQKIKIFYAYMEWLQRTTQKCLTLYLADPATSLAWNSVLGTAFWFSYTPLTWPSLIQIPGL